MENLEKELRIINVLVRHDLAILESGQCEVIYHYDRILNKIADMPLIYLREEIYNKIKDKDDEVIARILAVKSMKKNLKHYFDRKFTAKENSEVLLRAALIEKFYDLRIPQHDGHKHYVFRAMIEEILMPIMEWEVEEECLEDEDGLGV